MSSIGPDDGIVKGFASLAILHDGCFSLIGDANCFDRPGRVALSLKYLYGAFNALFNGSDDLKWVMFVPSNFF